MMNLPTQSFRMKAAVGVHLPDDTQQQRGIFVVCDVVSVQLRVKDSFILK